MNGELEIGSLVYIKAIKENDCYRFAEYLEDSTVFTSQVCCRLIAIREDCNGLTHLVEFDDVPEYNYDAYHSSALQKKYNSDYDTKVIWWTHVEHLSPYKQSNIIVRDWQGCICDNCKNGCEFSTPNCKDGKTFICWSCRTSNYWKFESILVK